MKSLKFNFFVVLSLVAATLFISSCENKQECQDSYCPTGYSCQDGTCVADDATNYTLSGDISANKTLTASKEWTLSGRVVVKSGVTLTIEPGTVIKGKLGVGAAASSLVVAKGAKIMAEGTAAKPIIFTSEGDNVAPGSIMGTSLDYKTQRGLWGGLIILGDAPISPESGTTAQIEGIPANVVEGNYGGANEADNSGVLKYVSIRFGGSEIGEGNEINGLTLGGVGSGTVIENIEVVANYDDGIEFFGGTVNVKNAIVVTQGDDAFDVDQAWKGTLDNFINIAGSASNHTLEIDGPEGSENAGGKYTLKNGTFKGGAGSMAIFKSNAKGALSNCFFTGYAEGSKIEIKDASTAANYNAGDLTFENLEFDQAMGIALADLFKDKSGEATNFETNLQGVSTLVTTRTVGATISDFTGWTFADKKDLLSGL